MIRVITLDQVQEEVGETTPVLTRCHCRSPLPMHSVDQTCQEIRAWLDAGSDVIRHDPDPSLPLLTYRCTKCKGVAIITLADVHLSL